jgi:BirA family transcriptional regulator, biotin operon repressor / biotin---[acetyl-CoA-carboxylase] ligase
VTRYDGLDARRLAQLTGAPLVVLESRVRSTQDEAHRRAAEGAPSGTVVLADEQTAGRGRQGRAWLSPQGGGVWLSLLLRPAHPPQGGVLAIRCGLACLAALAEVAPDVAARLRWPNDIVVAGRKLGGILCEARWSGAELGWVAVGVGLNVAGAVDPAVRERAIALADLTSGVSRAALVAALVPRLRAQEPLPPLLDAAERRTFLASEWRDDGAEPTADLAGDGALLVRTATGVLDRRVSAP